MNPINLESLYTSCLPVWPKNTQEMLPCALKALSCLTILASIGVGLVYIAARAWKHFYPDSATGASSATTVSVQNIALKILTDGQKNDEASAEKESSDTHISAVNKSVQRPLLSEADDKPSLDAQALHYLTSLNSGKEIPVVQVSTGVVRVLCEEVENQTSASVVQVSAKDFSGIFMKWKITHINKDLSYTHKGEGKSGQQLDSTLQTMSLPIDTYAIVTIVNGCWHAVMPIQPVKHRDETFETSVIVPKADWKYHYSDISEQKIESWKKIEYQDDDRLRDDHPYGNLGWMMSRLLSGQSVCVREWRSTLLDSLEHPAIGYWKIEISDAQPITTAN